MVGVLDAVTWRRFLVLVRGLSPQSATIAAMSARHEVGGVAGQGPVNAPQTPEEAQAAFVSLSGGHHTPT